MSNSTDTIKPNPNFDAGDEAAITAFWICGARAMETRKGDEAVIKDPYAEMLLEGGGWEKYETHNMKSRLSRFLVVGKFDGTVVKRTKFYDDTILNAAKEKGIRQLVALGAGLDTRAYRLFGDMPDMHVFEVDHPNTFKYKESRLATVKPACKRTILPLEYHEVTEWDTAAIKQGFDPSKPAIFVIEGLTMYIPLKEEWELYKKIDNVACVGSVITGCSQRVYNSPRHIGQGIIQIDTDRAAMRKILSKWGLTMRPVHQDNINVGCAWMCVGEKRDKPYESEPYNELKDKVLYNMVNIVCNPAFFPVCTASLVVGAAAYLLKK